MKRIFGLVFLIILFTGCAERYQTYESYVLPSNIKSPTKKPYVVNGNVYYPLHKVPLGWSEEGIASWYGPNFNGQRTSDGEIYNMYDYTAAHKILPMNTIVKVTNLNNGKSVIVRINDRGPFVKNRIIDLSYAAAKKIGLDVTGTAPVKIKVIRFEGKDYVSGYMIQVGAFIYPKGAQITAEKYEKLGYNTKIKKINRFYKVFITGFNSYDEAKKFKLNNNINGFIVAE